MKNKLLASIFVFACALNSFGAPGWDEQQASAVKSLAEYQAKYPDVRSDRFVFKTITLPDGGKLDLDMQIERPKTGGPFPVVFYVHGGGWITGTKGHFMHQSFELAKHGIAGVRMEYRWISQGGVFTNVIEDVLDSIDFVRQRKDELNLDFTRVGLAGGSAGGHLSAIAAQLTPECISYDGFNGLYDAVDLGRGGFGGGSFTGTTKAGKMRASAIYLIRDNPPDTFLYHGTEDTAIDMEQSQRFAEAIRKKGGHAEVLVYAGVGHSFFNKEPYLSKTTQALLDHNAYVFGLSGKKPDLSQYTVPPQVARLPDGFSLAGKWAKVSRPGQVMEFGTEGNVRDANGNPLRWHESYNNFYVVWKSGGYGKIDVKDNATIEIRGEAFRKITDNPAIMPAPRDTTGRE